MKLENTVECGSFKAYEDINIQVSKCTIMSDTAPITLHTDASDNGVV